MAILTAGTWVMVADGEKALFLRNDMDALDPNLNFVSISEQENPPTARQGTDTPGRKSDGGMGQRSAMEETDWHRLAKDRFADDMADKLYGLVHKGAFKRIVLVAPPAVLGELRRVMHKEVADRVVAEVDKTLTNHPIDKIEKLLKAELEG